MEYLIIESNNLKKFEYLNLEFTDRNIAFKNINTDNYKFICRIKEDFKHSLHTENIHLNALTDLVINLGYNLQKETIVTKQLLERITNDLKKYITNQDYIKEQNNQIIKELKDLQKGSSSKNLDNNIQNDIDKVTEAISKLSIKNPTTVSINKTPTPYKHWQPRK